jgi:hypothetical protein
MSERLCPGDGPSGERDELEAGSFEQLQCGQGLTGKEAVLEERVVEIEEESAEVQCFFRCECFERQHLAKFAVFEVSERRSSEREPGQNAKDPGA